MDKKQVNFSVENVFEVTFRQTFRGYNIHDVDKFVDKVVEDYATLNKEIEQLKKEVENLKKGYR